MFFFAPVCFHTWETPTLVAVRMTVDEFLSEARDKRHCWMEVFFFGDSTHERSISNGSTVFLAVSV